MHTDKKGFSLLEILITMTIIGVLAAIIFAALDQSRAKARDAKRASQTQEFRKALGLYYADNGVYPADAVADPGGAIEFTTTSAPATDLINGGYIKTIPADPAFDTSLGYYYCASDDQASYAILVHMENENGTSGYCETGLGTLRASASLCTVDDPILGADTTIDGLDACETRF